MLKSRQVSSSLSSFKFSNLQAGKSEIAEMVSTYVFTEILGFQSLVAVGNLN